MSRNLACYAGLHVSLNASLPFGVDGGEPIVKVRSPDFVMVVVLGGEPSELNASVKTTEPPVQPGEVSTAKRETLARPRVRLYSASIANRARS